MYSSTTAQYNPCMYKIENKTTAAVPEKKKNDLLNRSKVTLYSPVKILGITYFFKYFIIL